MLTRRELDLLGDGENLSEEAHRAIRTLVATVAKYADRDEATPTPDQWANIRVSLRLLRELL